MPPGWNEWYAAQGGSAQSVYDYQLNQNGSLVPYGTAETDFKQDVFSNLAVDAINRNAPGGPFFLGVMYTAPHSGGPNPNPNPPTNCGATAKPAPRHATAFDSEPLPTPPNFNEADVSDKPAAIQAMPSITEPDDHDHPAQIPLPDRVVALGRRRRQADHRRAQRQRRARATR